MRKKILLIDDSKSLRHVVSLTLEGAGYDVLQAEDGRDALNKLDGTKINLIVCDVNMPVMDGITFVTEMKKISDYRFTPIIMLTTESKTELKEKGMDAGVRAWMIKPFKPERMLEAVAKLIMA